MWAAGRQCCGMVPHGNYRKRVVRTCGREGGKGEVERKEEEGGERTEKKRKWKENRERERERELDVYLSLPPVL